MCAFIRGSGAAVFVLYLISLSTGDIISSGLAFAPVSAYSGTNECDDRSLGALRSASLHNTGEALVVGLPNSLVTIGLVRLYLGAGPVYVLAGIKGGILGGVTTVSTAR